MNRSRRLFIAAAVAFAGALLYASYDISTRTTFPGSKSQLKERIKEKLKKNPDSLKVDSVANNR